MIFLYQNITRVEIFAHINVRGIDIDEKVWNLFFDNVQKILFPEVWLVMDASLSKMEFMALLLLWRTDEVIMTQLAESINIPMSTATGVVDRLVKKEYAERLVDETNRRIVTVRLTQKGKDTAESFKQTVFKYANIFLNTLTDDEKDVLFKLFEKIISLFINNAFEAEEEDKTIKKITIE